MLSSKRIVSACLGCPARAPIRPFTASAAPARQGQPAPRSRLMAPALPGRQLRRQPIRTLCAAAVEAASKGAPARSAVITGDPANNVSDYIYSKMGVNLHQQTGHPIGIIKQAIYDYFDKQHPGVFKKFDDLYPIVSTTANFDEVLVPAGGRAAGGQGGGGGRRRAARGGGARAPPGPRARWHAGSWLGRAPAALPGPEEAGWRGQAACLGAARSASANAAGAARSASGHAPPQRPSSR
jgi:hypothetical protein